MHNTCIQTDKVVYMFILNSEKQCFVSTVNPLLEQAQGAGVRQRL